MGEATRSHVFAHYARSLCPEGRTAADDRGPVHWNEVSVSGERMKDRIYRIYGSICGVIVAAVVLAALLAPAEKPVAAQPKTPLPRSIASVPAP